MRSLRYVISGRVQGVGFRHFVATTAQRCGVTGWVRNRRDGTVEVGACGPDHAMTEFEDELHRGPRFSRVEAVTVSAWTPDGTVVGFRIGPTQ